MNRSVLFSAISFSLFLGIHPTGSGCPVLLLEEPVKALKVALISKEWAEKIEKKKGQLRENTISNRSRDRGELFEVFGVPNSIQRIQGNNKIFRIYVSKDSLSEIIERRSLPVALSSYVTTGFYKKHYVDLTGVFFTNTELTEPTQVGLSRAHSEYPFVDFTIDESFPIFKIEDDIFLVPLPQKYPEWIKKIYHRYLDHSELNADELNICRKIEAGASVKYVNNELRIPVEIKRTGILSR